MIDVTPHANAKPDATSAPPGGKSGAEASPSRRSIGRRTLSVLAVRDETELRPYLPAWQRLAADAIEPNVFYEPWLLLPALRHLRGGEDVRVALVVASDPADPARAPELCGLFPLRRRRWVNGLPVASWQLWKHAHCFLCTPLLMRGFGEACLTALFDWLARGPDGTAVVQFDDVSADGPFQQALVTCLSQRQSLRFFTDLHTRALLLRAESAEAYLRAALSGEDRRAQERRARRLAEAGRLEVATLEPGHDLAAWVGEFLELEAAGWKGKEGTALACSDADRAFLRDVAADAFGRGRLLGVQMRLDGRPIAQRISFGAGTGSFSFKTAFDETYRRFSPGTLLEIENIRHLHAIPGLRWMDSCTRPDNALINRLWTERRTLQSVAVATGRRPGGLAVSLLPLVRWLRRTAFRPRRRPLC